MRALIAALLLAALPAAAQETRHQLACGPAQAVAAMLNATGQAQVAQARSASGHVSELWAAPDGSAYTLVFLVNGEGGMPLRCFVDHGSGIERPAGDAS